MEIKKQNHVGSGASLSPGEIESFLEDLRARGRVEDTLDWYRRGLRKLYLFLPEEKRIRRGTLARWRSDLLAGRLCVQHRQSVPLGRQFVSRIPGVPGVSAHWPAEKGTEASARAHEKRISASAPHGKGAGARAHLSSCQIFASTGLSVQEIGCVSAESVRQGRILLPDGRAVHLAPCFCGELLEYAAREGCRSGPIFLDRGGKPMSRTNVTGSIKQLCLAAGIPEEKGNPRCPAQALSRHKGKCGGKHFRPGGSGDGSHSGAGAAGRGLGIARPGG